MPRVPARRLVRRLSLELLERRHDFRGADKADDHFTFERLVDLFLELKKAAATDKIGGPRNQAFENNRIGGFYRRDLAEQANRSGDRS